VTAFRAVLPCRSSDLGALRGVSSCSCQIRCYHLSVTMPKRSKHQRRRRATRMSSLVCLPSGQTRLQTIRRALPFINADVLQIITEYTAQMSSILCQRGVSKRWYGAVTEAVGFLNGRDWKSLEWWWCYPVQLSTHFTCANPGAIVRFMAVCLRERLERLVIARPTYSTRREGWSLRLLGERNDCLKHLHLRYIDVRDVAVLGRCSALEQVHFEDCTLDVLDVTAFAQMPSLTNLSLSFCQTTLSLSLLHQCESLLSLNLHSCEFVDNGSIAMLAQISSLTSLSLSNCVNVTNVSPLSSCLALEELTLNRTNVDAAGIEGLERVPTLRSLSLWWCPKLRDVTCLQGCVSLETLIVSSSPVASMGLRGLENIAGLRSLDIGANDVSTVVRLNSCYALMSLNLSWTNVDDAGIMGLESIASLSRLDLKGCSRITSVCSLRMSRSIRALILSETGITAAGLVGLNEIPTLAVVILENCRKLTDVRSLRGCRSLRTLSVAGTSLMEGSLEGLESVAHFVPVLCPWRL
jgi:hypothetical protein